MRLLPSEQAAACYVPQSYLARWRELMQEQGISLYEADIRPDDRYLMERFIYGQKVRFTVNFSLLKIKPITS